LIASRGEDQGARLQAGRAFYYLLIASSPAGFFLEGGTGVQAFYYLLIASTPQKQTVRAVYEMALSTIS
jgi:hypothetical protein